jgi:hypothetical protein
MPDEYVKTAAVDPVVTRQAQGRRLRPTEPGISSGENLCADLRGIVEDPTASPSLRQTALEYLAFFVRKVDRAERVLPRSGCADQALASGD